MRYTVLWTPTVERDLAELWQDDEAEDRYFSAPEKVEMVDGKLYDDDEQRLHMLGLLLENYGYGCGGAAR